MRFYWLMLGILAVWRVTHLLHAENGPWDVFVRLRRLLGQGFWGKLSDCFYCLSLWISAPFAWLIAEDGKEGLFLWLSFSAGAILLQRLTSSAEPISPPALYYEEKENDHVLLRESEDVISTEQRDSSRAE